MHPVKSRRRVSLALMGLTIVLLSMALCLPAAWAVEDPEWDDALHLSKFQFNYLNEEILPKIGGNSGSAVQSIPITVPPGRAGLAPQLALTYNSSSRNGWVGVGWNLDVGAIQRATRNGLDYDGFRFLADGAELVPEAGAGEGVYYRAKIEGAFSRYYYISATEGWQVTGRDGTRYYYGTTAASRQENGARVFKWCLDRVEDTNGNEMTFTYAKDQGAVYLARIDYSGGLNSVVFTREARPDIFTHYNTQFAVTTAERLARIETFGNGELAHTFTLTYDLGGMSDRSLLAQFKDNNLPPIKCFYQGGGLNNMGDPQRSATGVMAAEELTKYFADFNGDNRQDLIKYNLYGEFNIHFALADGTFGPANPVSTTGMTLESRYYHFPDVNGDGRADLVKHNEGGRYHAYISNGDGTFAGPVETVTGLLFQEGRVKFFADVNGDGLVDLVKETFGVVQVFLSNGDGTFGLQKTDGTFGDPIETASPAMYDEQGDKYLTDVNGDGLADYIKHNLHGLYHVQLANGDGTFGTAVESNLGTSTDDWPEVYPVDLNGDGLSDLVRWDIHGHVKTHLSLGNGAFSPEILNDTSDIGQSSRYVHFVDMNGDGLADFVKRSLASGEVGVHFSKGDGTFTYGGILLSPTAMSGEEGLGHLVDVTGDGATDIVRHNYVGEYDVYAVEVLDADLLTHVGVAVDDSGEDVFAHFTIIEYRPSSAYANQTMPFVIPTVATITTQIHTNAEDGSGQIDSISRYDYAGGLYDMGEREFRGFETVVETRPDDATVTTHYLQDRFFKNKSDRITLADPGGTTLQETESTWARFPADDDWAFVYLESQRTDYFFNPTVFSQTDYTYDNTHGGVLTQVSSGSGAEAITTVHTYVNEGEWVWREASETVTGDSSGQVRQTTFEYEDNTGNLLAQEAWLSGGTNPRITMTYDSYGNLRTQTNARGHTTTTDYDTLMQAFPVKITSPATNGVAHVVEYRNYDYRWGKPRASVDANGNSILYTFDDLGRLLQADLPDGGQMRREFYDHVSPRVVATFVKESVDDTVDVYDYYDGLGRKIITRNYGSPDADSFLKHILTESYFDVMGRNFLNVGPFFEDSVDPRPEVRTAFDHLNRPVRIEQPDPDHGILLTSFAYAGFNTTLTDPDGASKTEVKDYLGRITRVIEHADAGDQHTNYTYNAAGELRTVTNHLGHVTALNYDTLGRKTAMDDPDMGAWSYTYDANGNLKTQTDSKSQVITFDYDALDRMVAKSNSSGDQPVSYTYDETGITNGIGRLYEVVKGGVITTVAGYDPMGRSLGETQTIPGRPPVTTAYEYDLSGKLLSVDYPNWLLVQYDYIRKTGLLEGARINAANNSIVGVFSDYRPSGKLVTMKRGQITTGEEYYYLTDTFEYHPLSDRLEKITTQRAGDTGYLQNREYDYTPAGDIAQIRDLVRNRTYTYTYDKLHRLTSETATGIFAYKPDSEFVYAYNGADQPHAVAAIAVNGTPAADFAYDDNGNMTDGPDLTDPDNDMLRQLTWDVDNMPLTVSHNQYGTTAFLYDGNGRRVKKTAPGGDTTYYVNRYYEVIGGEAVCYIWAGNQRIARFSESDGMQFYIKDHLGSSSLMTDNEGVELESTDYFPFGGQRDHSGSVISNYKFTDQENDPETGLYNYDARLYDPVTGIFISPDSIIPDMYDPQDLDRFTYVRNNPLIYIDPDGHSYGSWGNDKYGYGDSFSRGGNIDLGERSQHFSEANWNAKEDTHYYRGATQSGQYKTKQNSLVTREYYDGQLTSETDSASVLGGMDRGGAAFSLNKQALSIASKNASKIVNTTAKQLQKKFKHAGDFGVSGNYSKANAKKFNSAINQHLNAPGVKAIQGTYRGDPVTHHLNPDTGLNVITDRSGNFVSGWRLGPEQLQNVVKHGGLN